MKNIALSLTVLAVLYGVLEWFCLPLFYYTLPPIAYPLLEDGLPVLLQASKQQLVPEHYIALAGDSYAMGLGDEYYHKVAQRHTRYGSAAQLHALSGQDVLSFGSAGNGSIAGIVTEPLSTLAFWQKQARFQVANPDVMVVYFYEGNDLNDNVEYVQHAAKAGYPLDKTRLHDREYWHAYLRQVALERDSLYQAAQQQSWSNQWYLATFLVRSATTLLALLEREQAPQSDVANNVASPLNPPGRYSWKEPGHTNQALVNHQTVQLPDSLQGPSMDLQPQEDELAFASFRESLHFLKEALPSTRIHVAYLPSVINSYSIESAEVDVQSPARRNRYRFRTEKMLQRSDAIATEISRLCTEEDIPFIDTRSAIRSASTHTLLHGPLDWNHFNEEGYRVLAETIYANL